MKTYFTRSVLVCGFAWLGLIMSNTSLAQEAVVITPEAIQTHVEKLASDAFEGRGAGTAGMKLARDYVIRELESYGLEPAGDSGMFEQTLRLARYSVKKRESSVSFACNPTSTTLRYGAEFCIQPTGGTGLFCSDREMVFVGHGFEDEEGSDYAALDVNGKVVVAVYGKPKRAKGIRYPALKKIKVAVSHGAVGFIYVRSEKAERDRSWSDLVKLRESKGIKALPPGDDFRLSAQPGVSVPSIVLHRRAAAELFRGEEIELASLLDGVRDDVEVFPHFTFKKTTSLDLRSSVSVSSCANVVACLPGTDPKLRDEFVVLSAHLDGLGVRNVKGVDRIFNGAVDNASGCATLLEVARVLSSERTSLRPDRSILFLFVTAEEQGIVGSDYFLRHPTVPKDAMVANINVDMVELYRPLPAVSAFGVEHSTLDRPIRNSAFAFGIPLTPKHIWGSDTRYASDNFRFVENRIPAIYLSYGLSRSGASKEKGLRRKWRKTHYHKPGDDIHQALNYRGGATFANFCLVATLSVADAPERPTWREGNPFNY